MSARMTDKERCPMECPHGDRCAKPVVGHGDFCNHRVCDCNEPNAPRNKRLDFVHRATLGFLLDRAENYSNSSGYRALFDELIEGIAEHRHVQCAEAGEYDDLAERIDRIATCSPPASKGTP